MDELNDRRLKLVGEFEVVAKIEHNELACCEHCGDLEAYSATVNDDGTEWCLVCAEYLEERLDITDAMYRAAEKTEIELQIKHYRKRVTELKKELDGLS